MKKEIEKNTTNNKSILETSYNSTRNHREKKYSAQTHMHSYKIYAKLQQETPNVDFSYGSKLCIYEMEKNRLAFEFHAKQ